MLIYLWTIFRPHPGLFGCKGITEKHFLDNCAITELGGRHWNPFFLFLLLEALQWLHFSDSTLYRGEDINEVNIK